MNSIIKLIGNRLYGSTATDGEFSRYGSDSRGEYNHLLKTQPEDWIYRNKSVTYVRNRYGHRCCEIEELSEYFILFTGCSLAEGIAVALEDTYAYQLSKELGLDYYNLSLSASGPDLVALNLSLWFKNIQRIPKLVVLQWPSVNRKFNKQGNDVYPLGPWIYDRFDFFNHKTKQDFMNVINSEYFDHYYDVLRETTLSYLSAINIPVVELFANDFECVDYGRDMQHPGIESNLRIVELIKQRLDLLQ